MEQALDDDIERTAALDDIFASIRSNDPTYALLEPEYIDIDYRDEFRNFYASTYRTPPNRCQRLHFFGSADGADRYLGFCVLRPIGPRPVCRTLIVPPRGIEEYVACRTSATVHPYDQVLRVDGFPFMEQDAQFGVCAHASVWMIALYHHHAFNTPRRLLSEIHAAALSRPEVYRASPSEGLSAEQVGAALLQLFPHQIPYPLDGLPAGEGLNTIACRYLNSRLPVLLTTEGHVTVLIGYGRDRKNRLFFIRSDESQGPYRRVYASDDLLGQWDLLFVPTPGRIYLSGEAAENEGRRIFGLLLRDPSYQQLRDRVSQRGRLRTRAYVIRAGEYKSRMRSRGLPDDVINAHNSVGTSNWIWIVELQERERAKTTRRCVVGELAFDATSDHLNPGALFGNLPTRAYVWPDPRRRPTAIDVGGYGPYISGTAIHDAPNAPVEKRQLRTRARSARTRARLRAQRARASRRR